MLEGPCKDEVAKLKKNSCEASVKLLAADPVEEPKSKKLRQQQLALKCFGSLADKADSSSDDVAKSE